jgi:Raf kinase inhibitor-like YbhB/YbcL family protein
MNTHACFGALAAVAIALTAATACEKPSAPAATFESQIGPEQIDKQPTPAEGFAIQSSAFADGGLIGREYSHGGGNRPPELSWKGAPAGTRSFALEVLDPDAPTGTFAHWLVWDIPASAESLAGPHGVQGRNDAGRLGWTGPEPPPGREHRYVFRLFALDQPSLDLREESTRADLDVAMQGHVLATTETTGRYRE